MSESRLTCPVCGEEFAPVNKKQLYCSADCRVARANLKRYGPKTPQLITCACGVEFERVRPWQRFCCSACRMDDFVANRADKSIPATVDELADYLDSSDLSRKNSRVNENGVSI
jgi:endogenous inhibitor of DNA gyrase (YacG/DUF329 family)